MFNQNITTIYTGVVTGPTVIPSTVLSGYPVELDIAVDTNADFAV